MTRGAAIKKHLPWAAIVTGLGILGALYKLDMVPWTPRAAAATKAEVTEKIEASESRQFEIQKALIQRAENTDKAIMQHMKAQEKVNERIESSLDKQDRRTWQILDKMK